MRGFWEELNRPIMALAPLAGVTDVAFRYVIAKHGKPDVCFTEFVSCDGLCSAGRDRLLIDLKFHEIERPICAQIFGATPVNFYQAAKMVARLGFDGVDINMGCPDRSVIKQGAGAAQIRTPALAKEIVLATKEGAGNLPVSVKTRIGFNTVVIDEWIHTLLSVHPAAITIHGRTKKEMSKVPARWEVIGRAADIARGTDTLILGNGDVRDLSHGDTLARRYGLDGIMLGRAILGNPWLFSRSGQSRDLQTRLAVLSEHIQLFSHHLGASKNFALMKRHFKAYVTGFEGAKDLRMELMTATCPEAALSKIAGYLSESKMSSG